MHYEHSENGWHASDALKHTHLADTPSLRSIWCAVANAVHEETHDEGLAVRAANAAVISERRRSGLLVAPRTIKSEAAE